MAAEKDDTKLLAALALALVNHPRASLQELAAAAHISKATLYRFCGTREVLVERLLQYGVEVINAATLLAELETAPPLEALRLLIEKNLEHPEISAFLIHYWESNTELGAASEAEWDKKMDAFFLRGQKEGVFRIDIGAACLTEIWVSILVGMIEAERRGRIARAQMPDLIERAFLHGAAA